MSGDDAEKEEAPKRFKEIQQEIYSVTIVGQKLTHHLSTQP
jgi:hypothetical protein